MEKGHKHMGVPGGIILGFAFAAASVLELSLL